MNVLEVGIHDIEVKLYTCTEYLVNIGTAIKNENHELKSYLRRISVIAGGKGKL